MFPLEKRGIKTARMNIIPMAKGVVLEIGSGTGVNLRHYEFENIESLTVTDKKLSKKIRRISNKNISLNEVDVENLPYEDDTFDYVIHTLVFCSVKDVNKGLLEIKRVLKPEGRILFIEHIYPEGSRTKKLFNIVNPFWKKIASGCSLIKDYENSLVSNGYSIVSKNKFMNTIFIYGEAKLPND